MLTKLAISQMLGVLYYQSGTRLMVRHNTIFNSLLVVLDNQ